MEVDTTQSEPLEFDLMFAGGSLDNSFTTYKYFIKC